MPLFLWPQLLAVVVIAPAVVAGAIAGDRERGILDHLFTTTLSSGEIVVGKLAIRLIHLLFVVLAGLPVLAAATIMGGIAPASLAAVFLTTLSTLVTVSAMRLLLSVWSARVRPAVASAYLITFGLLLLPLALQSWRNSSSWFQVFHDRWLTGFRQLLVQANPFWNLCGVFVWQLDGGSATSGRARCSSCGISWSWPASACCSPCCACAARIEPCSTKAAAAAADSVPGAGRLDQPAHRLERDVRRARRPNGWARSAG